MKENQRKQKEVKQNLCFFLFFCYLCKQKNTFAVPE